MWQSLPILTRKVNALGKHQHVCIEIVRKFSLLSVENDINSVVDTFVELLWASFFIVVGFFVWFCFFVIHSSCPIENKVEAVLFDT